jgi:HK97 family phage major capsid protein/HK97 family phage prohead protease
MTLVRKTAAGKVDGALSYVLSDATVDRYGDIIEPSGWLLDSFRKNPVALFNHQPDKVVGNWRNVRVEGERLIGDFEPAPPGTTQVADDVRRLIEANLLRATSVGFLPRESEPIDPKNPWNGTRYLQQELLETSIVSVPANPAALQLARSLGIADDTITLAFGEHAATRPGVVKTGGHAVMKPAMRGTAMNIGQQIQDAQARLNAARDELTEHTKDADHDVEQAQALQDTIEAVTERLASLERTERSLAARTLAQQSEIRAPAVIRRPLGIQPKEVEPQEYFWRAGAAMLRAYIQHRAVEDILAERYPDDEATSVITRAAVAGASTTLATWAAELVQTATSAMLQPPTARRILPSLAAQGTSLQFGPDAGVIKIPSEAATPNIAGSFVAEAQPIPVRRMGFTTISLYPHKVGVITRYSREIAQYSNPSLEGLVRDAIIRKTGLMLDTLLIDNVAGGGSGSTRPAGLINGVSAITATAGGGYAAILGDLRALTAPFYNVNAGERLVMLINPAQALGLMMTPGPGNTGFNWTEQFTNRLTIIESTVVPAGTVYMIDAADFVSVMGTPEFLVSEEATLHIEDTAPTHISTPGSPAVVAAPVESMYQTNQLALRLILPTTWAMRRTGMVQYIAGVTW